MNFCKTQTSNGTSKRRIGSNRCRFGQNGTYDGAEKTPSRKVNILKKYCGDLKTAGATVPHKSQFIHSKYQGMRNNTQKEGDPIIINLAASQKCSITATELSNSVLDVVINPDHGTQYSHQLEDF